MSRLPSVARHDSGKSRSLDMTVGSLSVEMKAVDVTIYNIFLTSPNILYGM